MRDAAERLQLQSGGGDDDVGVEALAGRQHDAGGVDVVDVVGHHLGAAIADVVEQIVGRAPGTSAGPTGRSAA